MSVILDAATISQLRSYDSQMEQLASEIDRAERAGIDVAELKAQFMRIETLRQGLIREYGPPPTGRRGGRRDRSIPVEP